MRLPGVSKPCPHPGAFSELGHVSPPSPLGCSAWACEAEGHRAWSREPTRPERHPRGQARLACLMDKPGPGSSSSAKGSQSLEKPGAPEAAGQRGPTGIRDPRPPSVVLRVWQAPRDGDTLETLPPPTLACGAPTTLPHSPTGFSPSLRLGLGLPSCRDSRQGWAGILQEGSNPLLGDLTATPLQGHTQQGHCKTHCGHRLGGGSSVVLSSLPGLLETPGGSYPSSVSHGLSLPSSPAHPLAQGPRPHTTSPVVTAPTSVPQQTSPARTHLKLPPKPEAPSPPSKWAKLPTTIPGRNTGRRP